MKITIKQKCTDDIGRTFNSGDKVEYKGHIPGGMIKISYNKIESILHPLNIEELS